MHGPPLLLGGDHINRNLLRIPTLPDFSIKRGHQFGMGRITGKIVPFFRISFNIEELGWKLYLCSSPPYQLQTRNDKRMHEYTQLAFAGRFDEARRVRDSLDPVREAIKRTKPAGKPTAHGKYWQELLGQVGGSVRHPMLELTDAEKAATRDAFESCGLKL